MSSKRVQTRHRHQLQTPVELPSAGADAGQYGRGAAADQSQRQPAQPRRRGGAIRREHRALPRRRLPEDSAPRRYGFLADAASRPLARARRRELRVRTE